MREEAKLASTSGYLEYVLEQLSDVESITYKAMMGEYILYCQGKIFGGVYDDRLLVKPTAAAAALMPDAAREQPYPGAKEMLLVDSVDDRTFLKALVETMLPELSAPGRARKRNEEKKG